MKCEICGQNEAAVHIQQIIGSEIYELHICDECAKKRGISSEEDKIELSVSELLTGLVDVKDASEEEAVKPVCPGCGKKFEEFRKDGKLGCMECYNAFHFEINQLLTNLTGNPKHKGKFPSKLNAYNAILIAKEEVKHKLHQAIAEEDYETAAALRDKIRELDVSIEDTNE